MPVRSEQRGEALGGRSFSLYAYPFGPPDARTVAVRFTDITAHKQAEAESAERARRADFRTALADALRTLADPVAVQDEATRRLGVHLGAHRAFYVEVEPDGVHIVVHRDYTDGVASFTGRYTLDSFGPVLVDEYRAGRTLAMADGPADPRLTDAERAAFAASDIRAFIGVPLVKDGRLVGILSVHHAAPRAWTADELALVDETAERTWAAVARARAEAALRESEQEYQAPSSRSTRGSASSRSSSTRTGSPPTGATSSGFRRTDMGECCRATRGRAD